jgi:transposase
MARTFRKFDEDFKRGAVHLVFQTGKPIAEVARELGATRARWATGARSSGAAVRAARRH